MILYYFTFALFCIIICHYVRFFLFLSSDQDAANRYKMPFMVVYGKKYQILMFWHETCTI